MARARAARSPGFTLVELVMVIAIAGIVAAAAGVFVAQPVAGFLALERRASLTDLAATALGRMGRELRLAVPNSIRVSATGTAVEMLRIRTGGRYRAAGPGDFLDFTLAADSFDVPGGLADAAAIAAAPGAALADCAAGTVDCLVIYNTGQPGADAYALDNVAAVQSATAASLAFARPAAFPFASAAQRFYVTAGPVTYLCEAGGVRRYAGHALTASQAGVDSAAELTAAGAVPALLVDGVVGCAFRYTPGTATRGGLVTLRLTLADGGERVTVVEQVHVENLP